MIPLNELQTGNRFQAESPLDNTLTECEVLSKTSNEIIARASIGEFGVNPVNAQPIPLSVEWLMNHNFQVTRFNDASFHNGPDVFTLYAKTGVRGWYEDSSFTVKCDFVHLLQNAYKNVKGVDLPIHPLP